MSEGLQAPEPCNSSLIAVHLTSSSMSRTWQTYKEVGACIGCKGSVQTPPGLIRRRRQH